MEEPSVPARIRWAVEMLAPQPHDRILEIGCGGGVAVGLLGERVNCGHITAIESSAVMVRRSRERNVHHISSGNAHIEQVALEDAAFGEAVFDRALAVNVNVFWTSPESSLQRVARMLTPGGLLCLVYQPPVAAKSGELARKLTRVIPMHGFDVPTLAFRDVDRGAAVCVMARTRR